MNDNINIEKSEIMDKSGYLFKHRIACASKKFRTEHGIDVKTFIPLKMKDGSVISLCVLPAHFEDTQKDPNKLYVTTETYENAEKTIDKLIPVTDVTLGCDPELFIVDKTSGRILRAANHFIKTDDVGNDGWLLELRPKPSIKETVVRDNLFGLIKKARTKVNKYILHPENMSLIGSSFLQSTPVHGSYEYGHVAGFHLHFGIPHQMIRPQAIEILRVLSLITMALDYYVGVLAVIPEGDDCRRRTNLESDYGNPGDFRLQFPTLEYRVPGGSLLRHPILTCGLLGLGGVVIEDAISRIRICTNSFTNFDELQSKHDLKVIYPNIPEIGDIFKLLCSPKVDYAKTYIDKIYQDLESMVSFEKHKTSITDYVNFITSDDLNTLGNNIEHNWEHYYGQQT